MKAKFILIAILVWAISCATAQTIRYVKPVAAGTGNGSSWANASADLQGMINASATNDQVWVAAGTYYPTATTDRTVSFRLKAGVTVYGDFPPTGNPVFADRNLALYETVLSGDIDKNDGPNFANNGGNSYHVVSNNNNGANSTAVLDGFAIEGGNANAGSYPNNSGGGMLNIFTSPTLVNVIFVGNSASANGGAMLNVSGVPTLRNAIFSGNNAAGQGGAIANSNASPNITHATFWDNNAGAGSGGMFSYTLSSPTIRNSIFWGNTLVDTVVSNIGGDAPAVFNSDIQGGYVGVANINQLPLFINSANPPGADGRWGTSDDGLAVRPCSPTVNTGTNTGVVATIDITGNSRTVETTTDMGAYECQSIAITGTRLFVDAAAAANGNGSSWATAFNDLQTALASARICNTITEIWMAKGTYKPTTGTNRTAYFELVNNVRLYGSFAGTETNLSQRTAAVMAANPTILSGDIDGVPDVVTGSGGTLSITGNGGNSYHVVYANGVNSNTRIDGFTISGGNANAPSSDPGNRHGGGMYALQSEVRIANVTFRGNNAATFGGAIYDNNGSLNLFEVNVTNNKANAGGGMHRTLGEFNRTTMNRVYFTGNNAAAGGAVYFDEGRMEISNSHFTGNYANQGGGFYMTEAELIFMKVVVKNNTATGRGGGMYLLNGYAEVDKTFIIENTANEGGGIFTTAMGVFGRLYLTNVVVALNHAMVRGGGLHYEDFPGSMCRLVTIYGNTAGVEGGGIFNNLSLVTCQYNILWGNRAGGAINSLSETGIPRSTINYSVVEGNYVSVFPSSTIVRSNPYFVNSANLAGTDGILGTSDDGLALSACSPAIDYGGDNLFPVNSDIADNPRYYNQGMYDMGAYESTSTGITLPTAPYIEKTQDISDNRFIDTGCRLIATVIPDTSATGAQVLSGNVRVQQWTETTPFSMVRRHYQITPATNASTAKARVMLYFTQDDFNDYNSRNAIQLPSCGSNHQVGCGNWSNLQVVKYTGSSPNGMPGGYPPQTPVIIPNSELDIWWEGKYWYVSFDVTGFSGFFVNTPSSVVPLNLLSFEGKATATGNLLNWRTEREENFSHFEIERSTDARQFEKIGTLASNALKNYDFLDGAANTAASYYYRLKMIDSDGKFTYSKTIRINNTGKAIVGQPYPNPTAGIATVEVNTVANADWTFSVTDVMGRVLQTFTRNLPKGNHTIRFDKLPQGVSYIKIESDNVHEFRKVMRQ